MTRQEFIDDVTSWWELLDFCEEESCDYCDNIYSSDARDDEINEYELDDWARNYTWRQLLNILSDLDDDYEYYRKDEYGEWESLDDYDFDNYKDDVLRWADDNDVFEDDEEEDPADYGIEDEDELDDEIVEEPMSMFELFSDCQDKYQKISEDEERTDEEFASLLVPA